MDAPALKRMTVPEFLAWAETQESGRYELVRGEIVTMAPERSEHVRAKQRAFLALEVAIRRAGVRCEAFVEGLAVVIDDETSYEPDALVNCGQPVADSTMAAPNPVVVVEVLSPSTRHIDKTVKVADYFRVPSLCHYLIVDLARRHLLRYRRQAAALATVTTVKNGAIALDPPGISIEAAGFFN
jgi:Uma2 family endonuclease